MPATCPTCGGDARRLSDEVVTFKCKCGEDVKIQPSSVSPESGVDVIHETLESAMKSLLARIGPDEADANNTPKNCQYASFVPPDVFCPTCHKNFRKDWRALVISSDSEALEDAHQRYHPLSRQYRAMARELVEKYGPLQRVEYLSHFPEFEIQFVFSSRTIYSGRQTGQYDIHRLSLGYYGEGPRLTRQFLDEAGFHMSYDEIASIKPGAVIRSDGAAVSVQYPSPPPVRVQNGALGPKGELSEAGSDELVLHLVLAELDPNSGTKVGFLPTIHGLRQSDMIDNLRSLLVNLTRIGAINGYDEQLWDVAEYWAADGSPLQPDFPLSQLSAPRELIIVRWLGPKPRLSADQNREIAQAVMGYAREGDPKHLNAEGHGGPPSESPHRSKRPWWRFWK